MLIRNLDDLERRPVDMEGVEKTSMAVVVGREHGAPNFALRSFIVEQGGHTPRHAHDFEHEVFVVDGRGTVLLDGQERPLRRGDVVYIPADEEHQFRASGDLALHFLCVVPMDRQCGDPTPGS